MSDERMDDGRRRLWRTVGFIEAGIVPVANAYEAWMGRVLSFPDLSIVRAEAPGNIDVVLSKLLPIRMGLTNRSAFVPCGNGWTALFENGRFGTDPTPIRVLSRHLECRSMRVTSTPNDPGTGQFGAVIWSVFKGGKSVRSIAAANDGGRWVFEQFGVAFEFEDLEAYKARIKSKRFTPAMMSAYLNHFGISWDDKTFYTDQTGARPSVIFQKVGGTYSEPTSALTSL